MLLKRPRRTGRIFPIIWCISETIIEGTNKLLGTDPRAIQPALEKLLSGKCKTGKIPNVSIGKTASRNIDKILEVNDK